jgi:hypothetical protein
MLHGIRCRSGIAYRCHEGGISQQAAAKDDSCDQEGNWTDTCQGCRKCLPWARALYLFAERFRNDFEMLREIGIAMRLHVVALAASLLLAPDAASKEPELGVDPMQTTSTVAGEESVREGALQIGVYDPHNKFRASPHPQIEHVFVYWQELDTRMLAEKISLAGETGRTLMVTVEPYTKAANWRDGGERLFADIAAGKFDGEIESSCKAIASFSGEYWIRWGHEMEDATPRYPWARSDPRGYVMAYRKFVDKCRKIAPRARFVWSPKGERGLEAYYPATPMWIWWVFRFGDSRNGIFAGTANRGVSLKPSVRSTVGWNSSKSPSLLPKSVSRDGRPTGAPGCWRCWPCRPEAHRFLF